jgi:hypothetical protein
MLNEVKSTINSLLVYVISESINTVLSPVLLVLIFNKFIKSFDLKSEASSTLQPIFKTPATTKSEV